MIDHDLSKAVTAILSDRLSRALAGVPGVRRAFADSRGGGRAIRHAIGFEGWSPTLHGHQVRFESVHHARDAAGRPRTPEDIASDVLPAIDAMARRQRDRAEDAARLGHADHLPKTAISHLQTDVALPALRESWRAGSGAETRARIVDAVRRIKTTEGHSHHHGSGVTVAESRQDDGSWLRVALLHVHIALGRVGDRDDPSDRPGSLVKATLRGLGLQVPSGDIPDALVAGLVGRPLSALAAIHPAIDGRTVMRASMDAARKRLTVGLETTVEPVDLVAPAG